MNELPRVSLFIFCYQQAEFIAAAIEAAFSQDYTNLQIIISDDASSDATFSIVQASVAEYTGSHEVILNRNPQNLGIGRHFINIMEELAQGELVVASAGDDISAPNRVSRIVEEWLASDKPELIAHALEEIDEHGQPLISSRTIQYQVQSQPDKWPREMALQEYLKYPFPLPYIGAALAYRRDVYLQFGTPAAEPSYEDHLMYFRALLSGGIHYFPQVLVKYRRHANNFTAKPAKPKPKVLNIPLLYESLLSNPTEFAGDKVGGFRIHQVITQQWLDYRKAVQLGMITVDVSVVSLLWLQLIWRHHRFLLMKGGYSAKLRVLRYAASQVLFAIRSWCGSTRYDYQDRLLAVDYAPPLRTVVFGVGSGGERALTNLSPGFHVEAVCDNNSKLHGSQFCGLPIISPQQLKDGIDNIDCIVIASTYFHEIKAKLTDELGVPAEKIARAPYISLTRRFPAGINAAVTSALAVTAVLLLLSVVGLVLF